MLHTPCFRQDHVCPLGLCFHRGIAAMWQSAGYPQKSTEGPEGTHDEAIPASRPALKGGREELSSWPKS